MSVGNGQCDFRGLFHSACNICDHFCVDISIETDWERNPRPSALAGTIIYIRMCRIYSELLFYLCLILPRRQNFKHADHLLKSSGDIEYSQCC